MTSFERGQSVSRRTALRGLGAGGLGLALAATVRHAGPRRAAAMDAAPPAIQYERAVVYGKVAGQPLLLDLARPAVQKAPLPAVILIHGGALMFGGRADLDSFAQNLADAGYVAASIDYRLFDPAKESNPWPDQLDDVQRAVRWLRANASAYGIDPARVGVLGHSSGAQLAAFLGTRDTRDNGDAALAGFSSRVDCVVDIAGTMDLRTPYPGMPTDALGASPSQAALADFSPISFVDATTAPFLIVHGGSDPLCPIDQSRRMTAKLRDAKVEVIAGEFPGYDHFTIVDWAVIGPEILAFLGRHLYPEA